MFFKIDENGVFWLCCEIKAEECMVFLTPPDNFVPSEMHNWKYLNGEFVYDPIPVPPSPPTLQERLDALEQAGLERDAALIELAAMLTGGA